MTENIDIRELFFDILDIVKFELRFYQYKSSPLFERIVKTRIFQTKLQKLRDFINNYFDIMYKDETSPINQAALHTHLENIARLTNYYDDLSDFYTDHTKIMITKDKLQNLIEYSHMEVLFLIFSNILDWEHYKSSLLFPTDKGKEKLLKEFLARLASSDIKEIDDIIDLEQQIESFIQSIEVNS
ncbi:MAG TPA: hypothetical protein ENH75_11475 [archaeon]|nr:hypothetical protein [archaeon]